MFFDKLTNIDIDNEQYLGIFIFTTWKKSSDKMLPAVGLEPRQPADPKSNTHPVYTNLTFSLHQTETLGPNIK